MSDLERELKLPKWRSPWARREAGIDPPLSTDQAQTQRRVITASQAAHDATLFWVGTLNTTQSTRVNARTAYLEDEKEADEASHALKVLAILDAEGAKDADAAADRARVRMANLAAATEDAIGVNKDELSSRSEVLRVVSSGGGLGAICRQISAELFSCRQDGATTRKGYRRAALLRIVALWDLFNIVLAALVWIPTTASFVVYSSFYSLSNLDKCRGGAEASAFFLPCVLTSAYLACLVGLLFLVPVVWRFLILRTDLVSVKGFPDSFYHVAVVKEIVARYRCAQVRIQLSRSLEKRIGYWNAIEVKRFLDEGNRELAYV